MIFITPNDIRIIDDHSEDRRRFMDSIICQYDEKYLQQIPHLHFHLHAEFPVADRQGRQTSLPSQPDGLHPHPLTFQRGDPDPYLHRLLPLAGC